MVKAVPGDQVEDPELITHLLVDLVRKIKGMLAELVKQLPHLEEVAAAEHQRRVPAVHHRIQKVEMDTRVRYQDQVLFMEEVAAGELIIQIIPMLVMAELVEVELVDYTGGEVMEPQIEEGEEEEEASMRGKDGKEDMVEVE